MYTICVVPIGSTCRAARCGTLRHVAAKTTTQCAVWHRVQRRGFGVNAALRVLTINDGRRDLGAWWRYCHTLRHLLEHLSPPFSRRQWDVSYNCIGPGLRRFVYLVSERLLYGTSAHKRPFQCHIPYNVCLARSGARRRAELMYVTAGISLIHRVQKKSDTFVFPCISHSFWTNFMKLSANIRK